MRRPVLLLGSLLATVTAIALVATALTLADSPLTGEVTARNANVALVERFYAAANVLLASGDASAVAALVAPDFLMAPQSAVAAAGRSGLIDALRWRHDDFPGMHLVVDRVQPSGTDGVVAQVYAEFPGGGTFLGLPLPSQIGAWAPIEVWRIAGGKLVERRTSAPETAWPQTLGNANLTADLEGGPLTVVLERATFAAGDVLDLPDDAVWRLVVVTRGRLSVVTRGHDGLAALTLAMLADKDARSFSAGGLAAIRNDGSTEATAMIVGVSPSWPSGRPNGEAGGFDRVSLPDLPAPSPAGSLEILAVAPEVALASVGGVAVGTVSLASGSSLALPPSSRVVLLAVDVGEVRVGAETGDGVLVAEPGHPTAWTAKDTAGLDVGGSAEIAPPQAVDWYVPPGSMAATLIVVSIAAA